MRNEDWRLKNGSVLFFLFVQGYNYIVMPAHTATRLASANMPRAVGHKDRKEKERKEKQVSFMSYLAWCFKKKENNQWKTAVQLCWVSSSPSSPFYNYIIMGSLSLHLSSCPLTFQYPKFGPTGHYEFQFSLKKTLEIKYWSLHRTILFFFQSSFPLPPTTASVLPTFTARTPLAAP